MGTRADFYVGVGKKAEWICSIAFDGYPQDKGAGVPLEVFGATTRDGFLDAVRDHVRGRDDLTLPKSGWPWPWVDSGTTDFTYCYEEGYPDGRVRVYCFGRSYDPDDPDREDEGFKAEFPDMSERQNVATGTRSGLLVIGG